MRKSKNGVHDSCVCVRAFQKRQMGGDNSGTRGKDKVSSIRQGLRITATVSVDFKAVKAISVNKKLRSEAEEVTIHSSPESATTFLASSYFFPL